MNNYGDCELCGTESELVSVGDIYICQNCIDEGYICCDQCQGYFPKDDAIVYFLKDGRIMCEDCAIYALNFSGLTDDDIDHIEGLEEDEDME